MSLYTQKIQIALADDHVLLRNSLAKMVNSFPNCMVLFEADHGEHVQEFLKKHIIPDILLLDISMPVMDGFETAIWMNKHYPQVKVMALTMNTDERSIIKMMTYGCKSFLGKDISPDELHKAITKVMKENFYLPDEISKKMAMGLHAQNQGSNYDPDLLSDREKEFLKYTCSELNYEEIAQAMFVSPRTVDGYRSTLYKKLNVKTRSGLSIYALKNGIGKKE